MEILILIVLLVVGFVLLIKGADFFVDGSSSVAKRLKVSPLVIGLTIVACGTSLPELSVSVNAAISGNNALAVSNVLGSNMFNLMVVLGVSALFCPLAVERSTLKREFPFSVLMALLMLVFGATGMVLGHVEGAILLVIFVLFLVWMVLTAKRQRRENLDVQTEDEYRILPVWRCIVYIVGGIVVIEIGGDLVVECATRIALRFGMSQNLVGLTIVAFGTSLPELATSIAAARKKELDMAVGNVIGSNIFNILLIVGVSAAIHPIAFIQENIVDVAILTGVSIIVLLFAWTKKKIVRWEGIVMLAVYAGYLVYIIQR